MKKKDRANDAFFALLRAGLWENGVHLLPYEPLDFDVLYNLAEDQSVVGLISAGLEHLEDRKVTKPEVLQFLKKVFSIETRNTAMNAFIEELVLKMKSVGISVILIKGQGIAQCYERPLWRSPGDIDFLLDKENYEKAKSFVSRLADSVDIEGRYNKHLGMSIDSWTVELHGTLRCGLSSRIDKVLDDLQNDIFNHGNVCSWRSRETDIFLPGAENHILFVFTHFLEHFYKGGIGLRQICDWCRSLWTYRESLDTVLLESRLRDMGLLSEWRAFAAFAVDFLGMPNEAMPLYDVSERWSRKAEHIWAFILKVGNFGKKRDSSYFNKYPYGLRKVISFLRRCSDLIRHATIFPLDSIRFFPRIMINGIRSAALGE